MIVLVTGSNSGLGLSITKLLEKAGHRVVRQSRSDSNSDLVGDLADECFESLIEKDLGSLGVEVIVHCAGLYLGGKLASSEDEKIKEVIRSNLLSSALLFKRVSKHFQSMMGGQLIVVNSIAALNPNPNEPVYGACKSALHYMTQALQLELLDYGVRVSEVFPGAMNTPMTNHREDQSSLMSPTHVAQTICDIIDSPKSVHISSIVVRNRK
jgi:short-subunit dehydrogenase